MVKLLVADDEQKICRLLETFFSERGFDVMVAHNGKEALSCIREQRPHLVFLDLHMPGLNGMDVLTEAKKLDGMMRIIIITAVEDEETIRRAKLLGASDYVIKPFSLEYLKDGDPDYPVIVDAGVGTASDVTQAMELGVDGVLLNTGIAHARDPVTMAVAMKAALEAGRLAWLSGRIPKKLYATASSPEDGTFTAGPR